MPTSQEMHRMSTWHDPEEYEGDSVVTGSFSVGKPSGLFGWQRSFHGGEEYPKCMGQMTVCVIFLPSFCKESFVTRDPLVN